jgi:WD40 repeat protein
VLQDILLWSFSSLEALSNEPLEEGVTLQIEEALQVIDKLLEPIALSDIQERVFRGVWAGQTYEKIAEHTNYESEYIKHIGYQLWQKLSRSLDEKVTKSNLQSVLRRKAAQIPEHTSKNRNAQSEQVKLVKQQDWGGAVKTPAFYGRVDELNRLEEWILRNHCRVVALLGMGGIGKSALAQKIAEQCQVQFDGLIWRSLRQAPPLNELLTDIIKFMAPEPELHLPEAIEGKLSRLLECLQSARWLVILDNMEAILWGGDTEDAAQQRAGYYRRGYEGYSNLLKTVGESSHQSCLLLTSREKPKEIASFEGQGASVCSLSLKGLTPTAARPILQTKQIQGTDEACDRLIEIYAGNPLALKIVTSTIQELFDGDIAEFLNEGIAFFGDIGDLLDEQFNRLSRLEKQIMFWLAVNQEPMSLTELSEDITAFISKRALIEAVESLGRRPLIEKLGNRFSQQPVVMEYMTERIVEQAAQEIMTKELSLLESHALLKATAQDYIRESQARLILEPILAKLKTHFKSLKLTEIQFKQVLSQLQHSDSPPGYSAGNIINLLAQLKVDLTSYDFSRLDIRYPYLRNVDLHQVNFAHANLDAAVFTETFGGILSIALSPDGTLLATSDTDNTVRLWRIADGKQLWIGKEHRCWIWSVAFSPDGLWLLTGSVDTTVRLWNVETGECVQALQGSLDFCAVAFSPDGNLIVGAGDQQNVMLWEATTGALLRTLEGSTERRTWAAEFSPFGQILITGGTDTTIKVWNVETGERLKTLSGHLDRIRSLAFHPNGGIIASGSGDHIIKLWDIETGECLHNFIGHTGIVSNLMFSPDGTLLVSSSYDYTIKLWQVESGQCLQTLQGHANIVWTVAFSPDGQTIVSGGDDHAVRFWDVKTGRCIKTWQGHTNAFMAATYPRYASATTQSAHAVTDVQKSSSSTQNSGYLLATGSEDQIIRLWNISNESKFKTLIGHEGRIFSLGYSPDRQFLLSGSSDRTAKLWDVQTQECLKTLYGHTNWIWAVDYSADGQTLATGSEDATIRLWNANGQCLAILQAHQGSVFAVVFSPNAKTLVSGGLDCKLKFWNIGESEESFRTLHEHTNSVLSVIFSPDGCNLASGSRDQTVKIWDVDTGACLKTLEGHQGAVWALAISPDGQFLASGGEDKIIKVWDLASGECLRTLHGHQNLIKSITFHPEGSSLVSGSLDETMKVWDIETGECLKTLQVTRPYEGMNITGTTGLTDAQKATLKALGAVEINAV